MDLFATYFVVAFTLPPDSAIFTRLLTTVAACSQSAQDHILTCPCWTTVSPRGKRQEAARAVAKTPASAEQSRADTVSSSFRSVPSFLYRSPQNRPSIHHLHSSSPLPHSHIRKFSSSPLPLDDPPPISARVSRYTSPPTKTWILSIQPTAPLAPETPLKPNQTNQGPLYGERKGRTNHMHPSIRPFRP